MLIWSDGRNLSDDMVKGPVKSWSPIVCTYRTAAEFVEETYEIADFVGSPRMTSGRGPRELSSRWTKFQACGRQNRWVAVPAEPESD